MTKQEIESEELLPSPEDVEAALQGAAQPEQPRNRTHNRQASETLSDCAMGCTVAPDEDPSVPPAKEDAADFEERAGIREYDGGFSRAEAEELAAKEMPELPAFLDRRSRASA